VGHKEAVHLLQTRTREAVVRGGETSKDELDLRRGVVSCTLKRIHVYIFDYICTCIHVYIFGA
jgi:hypothetical protein